ncbi:MAG: thiamine pyrophosphate-binding protein [Nocardiopsaceae bacterium]|jgi:acetolactate synthase-1/2/3 large subunit|nr:thiamine pyrophosphate-binding protein [Nocardiopsaceae bacterium]
MTSAHARAEDMRSGAEVLADMLASYGVTHLFMVPAILRRTMMELERRTPIARLHVHGEKAAAYMADGYARASGKPGICGAQIVGALNLAAGLRDAYLAHSPVIALTGGRDPRTKFRRVYQEADDVPAFEPVTKFNATVDAVERIPDMLRQAFRVATTGCPGPVHLQFGGNEGQIDAETAAMEALVEQQFSRVPPFRPVPEDAAVREALRLLIEADRPVIVAGGGVRKSGAAAELLRVAEALQIPVATSLNGKDLVPASHPLAVGVVGTYSRESANRVVARADLVCFVGSEAGGMTTHGWSLPRQGTAVVQIDIEPSHLGRHYPLASAVNGDARVTLARLAACHGDEPAKGREPWLAEVRSICAHWRDKYEDARTSEEVPTRPERICAELSGLVPDDGVVVADTGHAGIWMGAFYDISAGQRYLRSCGHLGWAFPAALGAKCALPDRPVVCFTGDAGLWYHLAEIETAVRWGINSVTVVNNNSSGNQSKRGFERVYGPDVTARSRELWTFTDVDFSAVADDVGALGIRVGKPGDLRPAIERALEAGRPVIVDVRTDPEILAPVATI